MGNNNEQDKITRTGDISLANSEVTIYLNKNVIDKAIDEYNSLKNTLDGWATQTQTNITETRDNSSGEASFEFTGNGECFLDTKFELLYERTTIVWRTLCSASLLAQNLLLRCENFCEILQGSSQYVGYVLPSAGVAATLHGGAQQSMCPELYLDKTYYSSGVISSDTEDAILRFTNIAEKKGELLDILSQLETEEAKELDVSEECTAIQTDCDKNPRLDTLLGSFETYVTGVDAFNTTICDKLAGVIDTSLAFDFSRTYEYPEIEGDQQNIVLQRAIRSELHEMGLTDEEINNALSKSSLTLEELACLSEAIVAEDIVYQNNGVEMTLFKAVLSGDATDAYNKYTNKLDDGETMCWYGVSKYIMGTVMLGESAEGPEALYGNTDEYMAQLNAALAAENPEKVINALNMGSCMVAMDSNYLAAITAEDCAGYSVVYRDYKKNMILNDMFTYLSCQIDNEEYGFFQSNRRHTYEITDVGYNDGLVLTINSTDQINHYGYWMDNGSRTFTMTSEYICGASNFDEALSASDFSENVAAAEKEQRNLAEKVVKDGLVLGGAAAGGMLGNAAAGAGTVSFAYDAAYSYHEGSVSGDVYKKYMDKYVKNLIDLDYKYASDGTESVTASDAKEYYTQSSQLVYDTYKYLSYTGVEDAQNAQADYYQVRLSGSAGRCVIDYDLTDTTAGDIAYCSPHNGFVAPEYLGSFADMATPSTPDEQHGLSAIGNWDPEFTKEVNATIDAWASDDNNATAMSNPELCKQLVNGGLDITSLESEDYKSLSGSMDELQKVYTYVSNLNSMETGGHVPDITAAENSEIDTLWGAQCCN